MSNLSNNQIQLTKNILYSQLMEYKEQKQCKGLQKDITEVLNILNNQQEEIRNKQYL